MRYLYFLLLLVPFHVAAQPPPRQEALQLRKVLVENHLLPRAINDDFSKDVFSMVLDILDPDRLYLTAGDIGALSEFRTRIDDEFNGGNWQFTQKLSSVFAAALRRAEDNITAASSRPFDFRNISLYDSTWAQDATVLRKRTEDFLELQAWEDLADGRMNTSMAEGEYIQKYEAEVRERVRQRALRSVRRQLHPAEGLERHVTTACFQAFAMVFDPHTMYLSPTQLQNMMKSLSSEGYYIGFTLDENDHGEIVITNLHPGGPAWKSGVISIGDVIEKVRWADQSEWIPLAGMTGEEINAVLDESNERAMDFSLRKGTGAVRTVTLRKEKFVPDYNLVKGFVLEGRHRIGYISLPDFYTDWGNAGAAQCANDVAREILKLKNESIEGVILDLRFNGGGSLHEAVAMAGIFIDAGPVGIDVMKGEEPLTLKDMNRGTVWDGPLLLLVNGASASASEFLAAALQDYNRAIIAGSRTFGKGIAQELFDLKTGRPIEDFGSGASNGWGFCSVTTSRMYGINGTSIQTKGVVPDIAIPQPGDEILGSEREAPFAIRPDSISKKTYPKILSPLPLQTLRAMSNARISSNDAYQSILNYKKALTDLLNTDYQKRTDLYQNNFIRFGKEFRNMSKFQEQAKNNFTVNLHEYGRLDLTEYTRSINGAWITHLSKDIPLEEAYNIVSDYIDTIKKK